MTVVETVSEAEVEGRVRHLVSKFADADVVTFLGAQFDLGLARIDYPVGFGGMDGPPKLQDIVDVVLRRAERLYPWRRNPMGIGMCAPTIVANGTDEQRRRFLRPIYTGEEIWCQLFSEPGAGSDVAGLATKAERDGDEWILNGQKVWTSAAHIARFGLLLARTNPAAPKHRGLTMFIVDMHQPGIDVRPTRSIAGPSMFNEVFLTEARTPDVWRIGEVNDGWKVANSTLMNERVAIGSEVEPRGSGPISAAINAWHHCPNKTGARRDALMRLWVEAEVNRLVGLRAQANREKGVPGAEGSVLKLATGQLHQRIASLTVELLGPAGMISGPYGETLTRTDDEEGNLNPVMTFIASPSRTIAGGTNEVQRNIIGERILGLPREPGLDPSTPWNEISRNT